MKNDDKHWSLKHEVAAVIEEVLVFILCCIFLLVGTFNLIP